MATPQVLTAHQRKAVDAAVAAHRRLQAAQALVEDATETRARAIARALHSGVSLYRLAQELGLAQSAVRNALKHTEGDGAEPDA